jgi:enoyl-CoA hydratase/carnithine racemase
MFVNIESIADGVVQISLSNPTMNLLSNQVKREIRDSFTRVSLDRQTRVILFEAEGSHFCCGADLKEFPERIEQKAAKAVWDEGHAMLQSIGDAPQPTIACIHGNALGGGGELALAFDFRLFADNAQIGFPEVTRGLIPGNGGLERLVDLAGAGNAMKLMATGCAISADEAKQMGLATKVVSPAGLHAAAKELALQLASLPGAAVQAVKRAVNQYHASKLDFNPIGRELFFQMHETEDVKEAVQAFIQKRKPVFRHR